MGSTAVFRFNAVFMNTKSKIYLHYNPVKHGLVSRVRYSSFHHYVRQGDYPLAWGNDVGIGMIDKSADGFE